MTVDVALTREQTGEYLARLGFREPPPIDADGLRALQRAHLRRVPFENFDIHLGVPIVLDVDRLVDKIVRRRRGGFCYELNGTFGALLATLGFDVTYLEARVYDDGDVGIPFDHLTLRVDAGHPHLVDVGFGACFDNPLLLEPGIEQHDPAETFVIAEHGDGWFDLVRDGVPQYRFSMVPRSLSDFTEGCEHHQSSPASHFTRNTICSIRTEQGRVTLRGALLIETRGELRTERQLEPDELASACAACFEVVLDATHVASLPR